MPKSMSFVGAPPITRCERDAVRKMACATEEFEPYPQFIIGASVLQSLIERGLVERGPSIRPAVDAAGFRLTEAGWSILLRIWASAEADNDDRISRFVQGPHRFVPLAAGHAS